MGGDQDQRRKDEDLVIASLEIQHKGAVFSKPDPSSEEERRQHDSGFDRQKNQRSNRVINIENSDQGFLRFWLRRPFIDVVVVPCIRTISRNTVENHATIVLPWNSRRARCAES